MDSVSQAIQTTKNNQQYLNIDIHSINNTAQIEHIKEAREEYNEAIQLIAKYYPLYTWELKDENKQFIISHLFHEQKLNKHDYLLDFDGHCFLTEKGKKTVLNSYFDADLNRLVYPIHNLYNRTESPLTFMQQKLNQLPKNQLSI